MHPSGAAEVRILIEDLYKFKVFGGKKLIREFSDKFWNVEGLNKLKRLRLNDKTNGVQYGVQGTVRTHTRAQLSLGLADGTHGAHSQPASITVRV